MLVEIKHPVPSDIEIAQEAKMRPILEYARELGLSEDDLDLYGKYKAKSILTFWTSSETDRRASTLMLPLSRPPPLVKARR